MTYKTVTLDRDTSATVTLTFNDISEMPDINCGKELTVTVPRPYGSPGDAIVTGFVESYDIRHANTYGLVEVTLYMDNVVYEYTNTTTNTSSGVIEWSMSSTVDVDHIFSYEDYYGGEPKEDIEMAKNLVRKVLVVRSDGSEYQFKEYGPYVSDDPDKLVRNVLIKYGSADPIFSGIEPESDALTFVVYALDVATEIPYLDVD